MCDNGQFIIDETAEKRELEKFANFTYLYDIWLNNMEDGKKICDFFYKRRYQNIAIYGMGMVGKHLYKQLENTGVKVMFTIERNIVNCNNRQYNCAEAGTVIGIPDVIVITPIMEFDKIRENLSKFYTSELVSVEEVVLSL
jgi:hypothetical protein